MQWEGPDLHTQLFSPNGAAQEVPVSSRFDLAASMFCDAVLDNSQIISETVVSNFR